MKVLIVDFDLFNKIGGGQTFYRSLIEKNPHIDFYYFIVSESLKGNRPSNAHAILYQEKYHIADHALFLDLTPPKWIYRVFIMTSNIAASVAGERFDVVDIPDYEQFGTMLRPALKYHNVDFESIALSMHGNISTSIKMDWFYDGKVDQTLIWQEKIQYSVVDTRYGISKTYLDEWHKIVNLKSYYLNPLSVISLPRPKLAKKSDELPDINFVGRTERRKGPDIFVELTWWLPRSKFKTANVIGPDSFDYKGELGSGLQLYQMINNRLKDDVKLMSSMSHEQLYEQVFSSKSVTLLPSKYDTFNLTALESLFSGCPTVIGTGAGIVRFLKETYPDLPLITIDKNNIYSCIHSMISLLDNYDDYRYQLVEYLSQAKPEISGLSIESIYESQPDYDQGIRRETEYWYSQLMNVQETGRRKNIVAISYMKNDVLHVIKKKLQPEIKQYFRNVKSFQVNPKGFIKEKVRSFLSKDNYEDLKIVDQGLKALSLLKSYQNIFNSGESNEQELSNKVNNCWNLSSEYRIDRVRIWRELARLEMLRGNDIVAATYQIRCMRSLGYDSFNDLPNVVSILQTNGFSREALAAEAMYGKYPDQHERCKAIINQALVDNKLNQKWEYEFLDNRRTSSSYRVSIIVSLYNAAAKLPLFLQTLKLQTLIQSGIAEVILVDSGSPADEYGAFKQAMESLDIPILYARCAKRETIQSAWNRGIDLARSPYLTFLGVDETILPECLEILAAELDADPTLDWVQANSLVTNVDQNGSWVSDVMVYDRKGYKQGLVYLETCYLSWVGALYRRSIHERFGFYDATFKAAGDTEFKSRVLPFIKTKAIPQTLGVFRNYPDERTTQHPRAEIEDLRAWYLHRTLAGVEYAFVNHDPKEVEELFYRCLRYRKSYCQHWSTDVEYAYNVGRFIQQQIPDSLALKYLPGTKNLLDAYRALDWIPQLSKLLPANTVLRTNRMITNIEQQHQAINNQAIEPMYKIFNDNRHEQHAFLWFTKV
ncbi:glycosyltransferase [Anabaena sp. UHCC 0399]|uniref:glycosyltransferase n=1 Tax=Anabaena sp. UHCC 0399 TaxID=3110238 RepID=UPI002B1EE59A|nr:glycosyltransferase [Anabaena sp. UHCC 0399]MEA5567847.1 glycosyltransferase [Anabaena sp. UHCC 0399]